jgi:hypothetical protein
VGPSPPCSENSTSKAIGADDAWSARWASTISRTPVVGSNRTISWFGSGWEPKALKPSRGACLKISRSSVSVALRDLPVRMKKGTPDQRQFSISSRRAAYVSVVEFGATPSTSR